MNKKSKRATAIVASAIAGYLVGLWAIGEFFVRDERPIDEKAEYVLDAKLSGDVDGKAKKYLRFLARSGDASHSSLLRLLGEKPREHAAGTVPASDTAALSALLAYRAKKIPKDSLECRIARSSLDSTRFIVPVYWAYRDLGLLDSGVGPDRLSVDRLKSLGKRLHQNGFPFKAAEVLSVCMKMQTDSVTDPEVAAWYGSALVKRALFVESSLEKIKMVKEGVKYLDRAVYEHPDYGAIRYIRANTYAALPEIFKKTDLLKKDVSFLLDAKSRNLPVKLWQDGKGAVDVPVNVAQLKTIIERAIPHFESDQSFSKELKAALGAMEVKQ